MATRKHSAATLLEKIRELPPTEATEVEDFVDFLRARQAQRQLVHAATRLSQRSLARIWNNPDDAEYDAL